MTCLEIGTAALLVGALAPLLPHEGAAIVMPDAHDAVLLCVLASACTLLPFVMSLVALRELSAFGATLIVNLEPVYAILLAMVLLSEQRELTLRFYLGVVLTLGAVLVYPLVARRAYLGVEG